ncbi:MAG: type I glyceraldehyde-3-phosphate dehydrogenase [Patescibacteria group bacterium]|nr:type I glyceraldehyde-3-phosphate dehydrogenase [Patescibacteria group bacterium]
MSINNKKSSNGVNIAINGFGRIGRASFKALLNKKSKINIVAINDLTDIKTLAHLLKYDSCYGKYNKSVSYTADPHSGGAGSIIVSGKKYKILAERDPSQLPWREMEVDLVLECTGLFRTREQAGMHLKAGAKKVIISAPAKSEDIKTIVPGVNENKINKNDKILSMASCTTNCLAPVTDIIRRNFGIKKAVMTTVHSYTADQNLVDGPHKDLRRSRAAAANIVPTTTGAAIATCKTIPQLKGKFDGMAIRVPTLVGSLCDIVFVTNKNVDEKIINQILKNAARSARFRGIMKATEEPIVSSDIISDSASAIVDLSLTKVIGGNLVKVVAWYDNEWGYSNRLVDLCEYIARKRLI